MKRGGAPKTRRRRATSDAYLAHSCVFPMTPSLLVPWGLLEIRLRLLHGRGRGSTVFGSGFHGWAQAWAETETGFNRSPLGTRQTLCCQGRGRMARHTCCGGIRPRGHAQAPFGSVNHELHTAVHRRTGCSSRCWRPGPTTVRRSHCARYLMYCLARASLLHTLPRHSNL